MSLLYASDFSVPFPFLKLFHTSSVPLFGSPTSLVTFGTRGVSNSKVVFGLQTFPAGYIRRFSLRIIWFGREPSDMIRKSNQRETKVLEMSIVPLLVDARRLPAPEVGPP